MTQSEDNELSFQISQKANELNALIEKAADKGLLIRLSCLERSVVGRVGDTPFIDIDVWRRVRA